MPANISASRSIDAISDYHAHVYYADADAKARAEHVRGAIEAAGFNIVLGAWHDEPVGPHPVGSYQIAFSSETFATLIPWMALNREGLSVLVHPNTDDPAADHSHHAIWLGGQLTLDIEMIRRFMARKKADG